MINKDEIEKMLTEMWEEMSKKDKSVAVTGKGGYVMFENEVRKSLNLPPLSEEDIDKIPEGVYSISFEGVKYFKN